MDNERYTIENAWHERYVARIQERVQDCTREFAEETLQAGMGTYDYDDNPEDAADEELSCWSE